MDLPKYCDSGGLHHEQKQTNDSHTTEDIAKMLGKHLLGRETSPAVDGSTRAECKPLQNGGSCQSTTAGQHMGRVRSVDAHGDSGHRSELKHHQVSP